MTPVNVRLFHADQRWIAIWLLCLVALLLMLRKGDPGWVWIGKGDVSNADAGEDPATGETGTGTGTRQAPTLIWLSHTSQSKPILESVASKGTMMFHASTLCAAPRNAIGICQCARACLLKSANAKHA